MHASIVCERVRRSALRVVNSGALWACTALLDVLQIVELRTGAAGWLNASDLSLKREAVANTSVANACVRAFARLVSAPARDEPLMAFGCGYLASRVDCRPMKKEFDARRFDIAAFAQEGAALELREPLGAFERLMADATEQGAAESEVHWQAHGEMRANSDAPAAPWLHVQAQAQVPVICQRCLQPMLAALEADRWFRFVANEETAAAEDDEAEEDVLVLSRSFDLHELVEDELLMEMPVAPRHEVCAEAVPMSVQDDDFQEAEAARPNPFAALAQLRKDAGDQKD